MRISIHGTIPLDKNKELVIEHIVTPIMALQSFNK
jgi:hypothetical protein